MKPFVFHPAAEAEYVEAAEYYAGISPELGGRFFDEIEWLIEKAREHPRRYLRFDPPAQRVLAHTFPFALVYLDEPEYVWVVAVMHLRREPGYWKNRVTD